MQEGKTLSVVFIWRGTAYASWFIEVCVADAAYMALSYGLLYTDYLGIMYTLEGED